MMKLISALLLTLLLLFVLTACPKQTIEYRSSHAKEIRETFQTIYDERVEIKNTPIEPEKKEADDSAVVTPILNFD